MVIDLGSVVSIAAGVAPSVASSVPQAPSTAAMAVNESPSATPRSRNWRRVELAVGDRLNDLLDLTKVRVAVTLVPFHRRLQ